jgi:hypothetical protein
VTTASSASSPDPVAEGAAYRAHLIGLVGEDDPAVVQASTPRALREGVTGAGPRIARPPEPGEWSVLQLVGHFTDAELVTSARYRWILAHDEPELAGYDQDLWVDRLGHGERDPRELLALFDALRAANLSLWARTGRAERARRGNHAERGPETLDEVFRMVAGHDRFHLAQIERALETLGRA